MKIKRLYVNNFKSLVNFELVEPNAFSVFVGANAAGKSNVFEALEFLSYSNDFIRADGVFGGVKSYLNRQHFPTVEREELRLQDLSVTVDFEDFSVSSHLKFNRKNGSFLPVKMSELNGREHAHFQSSEAENWYARVFSRIFINRQDLVKTPVKSSDKLALDCANLENVLWRLLGNEIKNEEINEWMQALVPGVDKVAVSKKELSGSYDLSIFEKNDGEPFGKNLISDGTYNLLALLTAIYQSDEPQFLCIEEPENGLTPHVLQELTNFFRLLCEEKGHCIWLNTHSPFLVKELKAHEIILLDKINGVTSAKQLPPDLHFRSMRMDEAWLTNSLGGGLPW